MNYALKTHHAMIRILNISLVTQTLELVINLITRVLPDFLCPSKYQQRFLDNVHKTKTLISDL